MSDDYFDDVVNEDRPLPTEVGLDDDLDQSDYAEDGAERDLPREDEESACACGHAPTPEGFEAHVRWIYREEVSDGVDPQMSNRDTPALSDGGRDIEEG